MTASLAAKVAISAAWALVTIVVAAHHEPWRDEADAWLFARDFDPLRGDLRRATACVGMPALWFAVLMPLAKSGLPYWTLTAANWLLAALAVWLLVWRSPLPAVLRVLLPFSFLLGYEYSVLARSYVLTVVLLLLSAALHPSRRSRPFASGLVIGLLANTNSHGFFIAFGLGVGFVLELRPLDRRGLGGAAVALALGAAALWQLYPHPDGQLLSNGVPELLFASLGSGFIPVVAGTPSLIGTEPLRLRLAGDLALTVTLCVLLAGIPRRTVLLSAALALGGLLFIFGFKYYGGPRHHGLMPMVLVWTVWVLRAGAAPAAPLERPLKIATAAWVLALVLGLPTTVASWYLDVARPFSGSREVASFLVERGLEDGLIGAHPLPQGSAVLPYLRAKTFWSPTIGARRSHCAWDQEYQRSQEVTAVVAAELAARQLPVGSHLVLATPLVEPGASGYELVFVTQEPFRYDERYWLYRLVGPPRARTAAGP